MNRHVVVVSLDSANHVVLDKNPVKASNDEEIQWTSSDGDITITLPAQLLGGTASDPPVVRQAGKEQITQTVVVKPTPPAIAARNNSVWYRYDAAVHTLEATYQANAAPHVIVTGG
jgi:hypothetical protein